MYDARCSACGKDTKVVFPPDSSRPVYCKSCLKKLRREKEEKRPTVSLQEAVGKEPISFVSQPAKEKEKPKRKEVNLEELKKTLEESLKKVDEDS